MKVRFAETRHPLYADAIRCELFLTDQRVILLLIGNRLTTLSIFLKFY